MANSKQFFWGQIYIISPNQKNKNYSNEVKNKLVQFNNLSRFITASVLSMAYC